MNPSSAFIPTPEIALDGQGALRSLDFDDVYFSACGGVAETEHVFLAGNGLPERWLAQEHFTIGELGFGSGLNFLVAWKKFVETTQQGILHFVSLEKFPLTIEQLKQVLAHQPELAGYAQQLIAAYPLRLPGLHRIHFDRVVLTLGFGDVAELLPQLDAKIDAWFLDGFAPAKNETMWSDNILQEVARLSAPGASFATFTAAGVVNRGLQEVGFAVEKVKGFGSKREMLSGRFAPEGGTDVPPFAPSELTPSLRYARGSPSATQRILSTLVIGGGIAGCTVARVLAERGIKVTLLESGTIASGASGNEAAVLYPQLTKYYTPVTEWHFTAYGFALRALKRWQAQGLEFSLHQPSMLKIGKDEKDDARLRSIRESLKLDPAIARWVEKEEASQLIGQQLARGGFWFAQGAWLNPRQLCCALVKHPNITVREHSEVTLLEDMDAAQIVVANAKNAAKLLPQLKLGISAGQVSEIQGPQLKAILCHKGYAIPHGDTTMLGATYDRRDLSGAVSQGNHEANIAELKQAVPGLGKIEILGGRTSLRATTPSRLPYVGMVKEGLYVSAGHGSRGMIGAPLAAELIASMMMGEPLPVTRSLLQALHPSRG